MTLQPRPNYWAALLWRRLMGEIVLDRCACGIPRLKPQALKTGHVNLLPRSIRLIAIPRAQNPTYT